MEGLAAGADAVLVGGCKLGECKYLTGNFQALFMSEAVKAGLKLLGLSPQRLRVEWLSAAEPNKLVETLRAYYEELSRLGPLGQEKNWSEQDKTRYLQAGVELWKQQSVRIAYGRLLKELHAQKRFLFQEMQALIQNKLVPKLKANLEKLLA